MTKKKVLTRARNAHEAAGMRDRDGGLGAPGENGAIVAVGGRRGSRPRRPATAVKREIGAAFSPGRRG